jgi:hypothetical protein
MSKDGKIKVRIFFEVMGWPADALTQHLKTVVEKLRKTWVVRSEHYEEPVPLENHPKMLTAHAEFEADVPSFNDLVMFCMLYGPSVVEILEPAEFYLKAGQVQDILADLISRMQLMDKEIKFLAADNKVLRDKLASLGHKSGQDKTKEVTI